MDNAMEHLKALLSEGSRSFDCDGDPICYYCAADQPPGEQVHLDGCVYVEAMKFAGMEPTRLITICGIEFEVSTADPEAGDA